MPIAIVTRQPRRIQTHDQTSLAEANFRDQSLKSVPLTAGASRLTQIVVDNVDALPRPAEQDGPLNQAVLEFRTLLMVTDLARR
jgi:hypothetical protein